MPVYYTSCASQGGWRVLIKDNQLYATPLGRYNTPIAPTQLLPALLCFFQGGWRVLIKDNQLYVTPLGRYNTTEMNEALRLGTMQIDHFLLLLIKML